MYIEHIFKKRKSIELSEMSGKELIHTFMVINDLLNKLVECNSIINDFALFNGKNHKDAEIIQEKALDLYNFLVEKQNEIFNYIDSK